MAAEQEAYSLIESWVNGNRAYVIGELSNLHPAITAKIVSIGLQEGSLDFDDLDVINRMLFQHMESNLGHLKEIDAEWRQSKMWEGPGLST